MKTNNISVKVLTGMLIMASVTTGCKDSFLNPDPLSLYEPTATFSSQAGLDAALASADKGLKAYWTNTNAIDLQLPLTSEAMFSDITVASKTDDAFAFTDIKERFTPTQGYFNDDRNRLTIFWGETYNGIKYANTVIHYLPKVTTLDAATRDAYMGRAYFHRAYRYLNLCFEFGNVPLVTKVLESPKLNYKSTKKEAIIKMITKDMEFAVQRVPEQSQMTYLGMINKGACRQLLIKCYLANGDFEKAKLQADTLINYSGYQLMTDNFGTFVNPNPKTWNITENVIWDLHRPENKSISANKEAILIMANRYGTDSGIRLRLMRNVVPWWNSNALKTPDTKLAVNRYSLTNSLYEESLDYNRAFGRGVGVVRPTYWAEKGMWNLNGKLDETDLRHNSKVGNWVNMEDIKYNVKSSSWHGKNLMKSYVNETGETVTLCSDSIRAWFGWPHYKTWLESPQDDGVSDNNYQGGFGDMYCYRLAETYLLRAEAKYYLGDPTAVDDVNILRKRAHCSQLYDKVDIDDIADERARELYLEEWRFTELNRISYCLALSGKPDKTGTVYDKDKLYENSFWWHRICDYNNYYNKNPEVQIKGRKYTMGKHNYNWPIPQTAIDANRNAKLYQNYGYDGYDASVDVWKTWEEAVADE